MFISWQNYESLQITVLSFKEVCKFQLQQDIPYIHSERFCQDDLEHYFINNVLLVVDLIIQQYMILDIIMTQLKTNFWSDPLEEMCKVLQENLMKYVMNLCRNKENKMSPKNSLLHWQCQGLLTLNFNQTAIFIATLTVRDY